MGVYMNVCESVCVSVRTYSRADTGIPGRVPGVDGSNRTIIRNRSRNKYARMRYCVAWNRESGAHGVPLIPLRCLAYSRFIKSSRN